MRLIHFCLALPIILLGAQKPQRSAAAPSGPVVHLAGGALQGWMQGDIAVFEGLPFAKPPVGDLRWRPPQPADAWTGVRDATRPSHPCMQRLSGTDSFFAPLAAAYGVDFAIYTLEPSEDCLYLNVWTPQLPTGANQLPAGLKLPVMVWIHGGSNRVGVGADYDGSSLAAHGVIVVTFNYRLGAMGFFAHPELTAESAHHSSGNYGLLDQLAALQWVQGNIAQFGGDAANVTIFGESAGSVDATTLMISPLAKNLFQRVIAESGVAFGLEPERNVAYMEPLGVAVGREAGTAPGAQLEALRKLPATQITQIEDRLIASQFPGYNPNASVVDGWVLAQSPAKAFASGAIQPVDLLVGLNAREFSAFRVVAEAATAKSSPPPKKPGVSNQLKLFADLARPLYGSWTDVTVATYMARILLHGTLAVDQASNDILGACPVGAEAALTTNAGRRAFVYRFDRSVPGQGESNLGAFHSLEIPYVFGTFTDRVWKWLPVTETDHKLSRLMQTYWTNFAKSGDPNGAGVPQWAAWTSDQESYLVFGEAGDAVTQRNFSPIYCHLSVERLKTQLANY
ncbi:MAG: carboxylesterase family protein [Candidatus Acidiferrum sp.]